MLTENKKSMKEQNQKKYKKLDPYNTLSKSCEFEYPAASGFNKPNLMVKLEGVGAP